MYAAFATSDAVIAGLQQEGLLTSQDVENGKLPIVATAVPSTVNAGPTPLLKISATGTSPRKATELTIGATNELIRYVGSRQDAAEVPKNERVELRVVKQSAEPTLVKPRSKSTLIVILLAGLTATVAAALIRDNMQRKRPPQWAGQVATLPVPDTHRRSPEFFDMEHRARSESDPRGSPVLRPPDAGVHEHDG